MTWPTLTNFSDGNTPTAAQLNDYLTAMEHLHDPPTISYTEPQGSNLTTTATTWADVSANFSLQLTTTGGLTLVVLIMSINNLDIDVSVNGTRRGTSGVSGAGIATARHGIAIETCTLPFFVQLSAGTHTFAAQWRVPSAGTGTIYVSNAPRMFVREL